MKLESNRIFINSKEVLPNSAFIAMKGPYKDGHDYIEEAISLGANQVILDNKDYYNRLRKKFDKQVKFILVNDSKQELYNIAYKKRSDNINIPIIAVTGSSGKTTTKAMLDHILSGSYNILKTPGNNNNLIGVPLALLKLSNDHNFGVFELGTNSLGEIKKLSELVRPKYAVLTNVSFSHLSGFGSIDNIIKEKTELLKCLPSDGIVCVNNDDLYINQIKKYIKSEFVTIGIKNKSDFMAKDISIDINSLRYKLNRHDVVFACSGLHNVYNSLSAIAMASIISGDLDLCINRLANFQGVKSRFEIKNKGGVYYIDDTYNANPNSFFSAIETIKLLRTKFKRIIAFVSDMLELGDNSQDLHQDLGRHLGNLNPDKIFIFGNFAKHVAEGLRQSRLSEEKFSIADMDNFSWRPSEGDLVFVKGSRGTRMERVFYQLGIKN